MGLVCTPTGECVNVPTGGVRMTKLSRALWTDASSIASRGATPTERALEIAILIEDALDVILPASTLDAAVHSDHPLSILRDAVEHA